MSQRTEFDVLQSLQADELLQELSSYVMPLSLPSALGVARNEVAHSNLLSTLLDPRLHSGADIMLRTLLRSIAGHGNLDPGIADELSILAGADWKRVDVRRELFRIDVVVEVSSAQDTAVIGIENKIDAGEQHRQIARYQEALETASVNSTALMVFLTPNGREPTTAREGGPVPVVAFMLTVGADGTPYVRVLIWGGQYRENPATLASWARGVNAAEGRLIDENFTSLSGWSVWRRVLYEDDYPPDANLEHIGFDEDTARAAADAVTDLYDRLRPHVEERA